LAQLEAIGADLTDDDRASIATLAHRKGRVLDRLDRGAEAADQFLIAPPGGADVGGAAGQGGHPPRHAPSPYWAHRPARGAPAAVEAAEGVSRRVATEQGDAVAWALGQLAFDGARILWQAGDLAGAADRAEQAARTAARVGKAAAAAEAWLQLAQIAHAAEA